MRRLLILLVMGFIALPVLMLIAAIAIPAVCRAPRLAQMEPLVQAARAQMPQVHVEPVVRLAQAEVVPGEVAAEVAIPPTPPTPPTPPAPATAVAAPAAGASGIPAKDVAEMAQQMEQMRAETEALRAEMERMRSQLSNLPPELSAGKVTSGDVVLRSSDYTVSENEIIGGNLRTLSGDLEVLGEVKGDVSTVSGDIDVNGTVRGNVTSVSGDLTLGPDAVVQGGIKLVSGDLRRAEGSQVMGSISGGSGRQVHVGAPFRGHDGFRTESAMFEGPFNLPFFITFLLAGMVMLVAMPRRVDTVGRAFVNRPGHSFLVGLASFPLVGLAILVSLITVIIPIMLAMGFVGAFLMGVCAMALMLGLSLIHI